MGAESVSTISTYFLLWAFRRIWNRVAAVGRLVATDMPGFGHSDGRPELIASDGRRSVSGPRDR
jgi:pimeloyl-ACP methyl ester carboxylesterase